MHVHFRRPFTVVVLSEGPIIIVDRDGLLVTEFPRTRETIAADVERARRVVAADRDYDMAPQPFELSEA